MTGVQTCALPILASSPALGSIGALVRSSHERFDGGGYPDGLAGEAIPLESRIISCCDTWNAMRTDRSYRKALPFEIAAQELESISGTQLDPRIVAALLETVQIEQGLIEAAGAAVAPAEAMLSATAAQARIPAGSINDSGPARRAGPELHQSY